MYLKYLKYLKLILFFRKTFGLKVPEKLSIFSNEMFLCILEKAV